VGEEVSTPGNGGYVTWGRYDAEHQAVMERLTRLEGLAAGLTAPAAEMRSLGERLGRLESAGVKRKERAWLVTVTVLAGLVCPVVVTAIITVLHLSKG